MKKAFVRYGVLGLAALSLLVVAVLALPRGAHAQGIIGQEPDLAMISGPVQLHNQPGQSVQDNIYLYAPGQGSKKCATEFDFLVDVIDPTGGVSTLRRTYVQPHILEVSGRVLRLTMVQNGDNWDLYKDGALMKAQCLNGLPPGVPVLSYVVTSHTSEYDPLPDQRTEMGGTLQCVDASGATTSVERHKELTGHVTLIK